MTSSGVSESESGDKTTSDEDAVGGGGSRNEEKLSDYEKARLKRIEENKVRMEALGLRRMACSLVNSVQESHKTGGGGNRKKKTGDDDEEYNPGNDNEMSSSGEEEEEDEDDEDFSVSLKKKKQEKVKRNTSIPTKQGSREKVVGSDFVDDDDDDLMRAIALSLQDSVGLSDIQASLSQSATVCLEDITSPKTSTSHNTTTNKRKANLNIRDNSSKKRKSKKLVSSQAQMSEDEVLVHFFQFDETGIGSFNLRDLQRLAIAHDFIWSEKEMADMIACFDSNNDGKISFEDFRNIVCRCNMLKVSSKDCDPSV